MKQEIKYLKSHKDKIFNRKIKIPCLKTILKNGSDFKDHRKKENKSYFLAEFNSEFMAYFLTAVTS